MRRALPTWLGMGLPWLAGTVLLGVFCYRTYMEGWMFVRAFHAFGWILYAMIGGVIYLAALLISAGVLVENRKTLVQRGTLGRAILLSASSLAIPLLAPPAMSGSFFAGRDAAYGTLDYPSIYQACLDLRERIPPDQETLSYQDYTGHQPDLPEALRRLKPAAVSVDRQTASIDMDGGGVMYREGIMVVFPGGTAVGLGNMRPLHPQLPVYLYRSGG